MGNHRSMTTLLRITAVVGLLTTLPAPCFAYTPEDPVVQEMVNRGIKYLESTLGGKTQYPTGKAHIGGWGEWALAGYAHYKVEHNIDSPVVQKGLEGALGIANGLNEKPPEGHHAAQTNYNIGVAALLLAEVDRDKYKRELEALAAHLRKIQFRNGAYGYYHDTLGDTSQTQYAMLALWTLDHAGITIDYNGVPKTAGWLMRTQDLSGGWTYRATDPGGNNRISQAGVTPGLSVAGACAVLISGDILRLWGNTNEVDPNKFPGLPKAIKLPKPEDPKQVRPRVTPVPYFAALENVQKYLNSNSPNPGVKMGVFPYYTLYSIERFESFKELAFNSKKNPSPEWYNTGVDFLKNQQDGNGAWTKNDNLTSTINTSFAVLFLIRSTQKAIAAASTGALAGGWGLPKDTTKITVNGTQIKGEPEVNAVTDLLGLLEADGADNVDSNSIPEDMKLATEPEARRVQIERLERLLRGSKSWQARRVAARLLGTSDQLSVVPTLIFAISDNDKPTRRYAINGLQFISRKFDLYDLPENPDTAQINDCQKKWIAWYQTMYPNFVYSQEGF